jgi:hypothetical protein
MPTARISNDADNGSNSLGASRFTTFNPLRNQSTGVNGKIQREDTGPKAGRTSD